MLRMKGFADVLPGAANVARYSSHLIHPVSEVEPFCAFSLATNENWKDKVGNAQEHTEWHSIVAFGRLGEIGGEYLTKGRLCYIEGFIRSGKWTRTTGIASGNRCRIIGFFRME
jgi:single stranded DNA-binding protein